MEIGDALFESALISNYDPNKLKIEIVSVVTDEDNNATVDWSYDKSGGEPYSPGSTYPDLPAGLLEPLTSVVIATVDYRFNPRPQSPYHRRDRTLRDLLSPPPPQPQGDKGELTTPIDSRMPDNSAREQGGHQRRARTGRPMGGHFL